jgi:hypothetical protein
VVLNDGNQSVLLGKDQPPYKKVAGHMADLKYPPENRTFRHERVDDSIQFGGDSYNIVAITSNEVVLSAQSTSQRTRIKWKAAGQ